MQGGLEQLAQWAAVASPCRLRHRDAIAMERLRLRRRAAAMPAAAKEFAVKEDACAAALSHNAVREEPNNLFSNSRNISSLIHHV